MSNQIRQFTLPYPPAPFMWAQSFREEQSALVNAEADYAMAYEIYTRFPQPPVKQFACDYLDSVEIE